VESSGANTFRLASRVNFWTGAFWVLKAKDTLVLSQEQSHRSAVDNMENFTKFIFRI
jgi:hypothetical protein